MAYKFTFDLSKLPKELLEEATEFCYNKKIGQKIEDAAKKLVEKFKVDKLTGLSRGESNTLIEDIIDIQLKNKIFKKFFQIADEKALFLPHCCRQYMDSNCKAEFKTDISSYVCRHCSKDCMANQATALAKKEGYDVYILPGASCISKIFEKKRYGGIVGVACTDEIKLAMKSVMKLKIPSQAVPLIKNGCAGTIFNFENLERILSK
jgi:hypothetical protein